MKFKIILLLVSINFLNVHSAEFNKNFNKDLFRKKIENELLKNPNLKTLQDLYEDTFKSEKDTERPLFIEVLNDKFIELGTRHVHGILGDNDLIFLESIERFLQENNL